MLVIVDLIVEALTDKQWLDVYTRCNAFVSLHHSEWEGLKFLKAIALQKPTIATDFGANTDYFSIQSVAAAHYPIPYVIKTDLNYTNTGAKAMLLRSAWVVPNQNDAVHAMKSAHERRDSNEHNKMLKEASKIVRDSFSASAVSSKMLSYLRNINYNTKRRVVTNKERSDYQRFVAKIVSSIAPE
jgi:glycosyltransferase involved in cell wall biosynthesis